MIWVGKKEQNLTKNRVQNSGRVVNILLMLLHSPHILAAMIDFILDQTNQTQLIYTGYSQGGTSLFVLLSELPEYNEKLASIHLMAPAIFYTKTNPLITPLLKNVNTVKVCTWIWLSQSKIV